VQSVFLRISLYLLFGVLGLSLAGLAGGGIPGEIILLFFCLFPCLSEKKRGLPLPAVPIRRPLSSLLFFPLLLGATVGVSFLTSLFLPTSASPTFTFSVFLTSAFFPALSEELLFRHLLLSLLLPLGKQKAALLSALLFALFHQNFYQMPYAFTAGLVLAAAALYSHSFTLPFLLHLTNNLLSLTAGRFFTPPLLLLTVAFGMGSLAVLCRLKWSQKREKEASVPLRPLSLLPLLPFVLLCLIMALLRLLSV
jgi:membrane protease YdiL (CAAX protease family)